MEVGGGEVVVADRGTNELLFYDARAGFEDLPGRFATQLWRTERRRVPAAPGTAATYARGHKCS